MILVHLLLVFVVLTALIVELVTPLVLNIPMIAVSLAVLVFTVWSFKRARKKKTVPLVASLALLVQFALFAVSIAILIVVTLPHESAEDSPAVVQGIRNFLVRQGVLEKGQATIFPQSTNAEIQRKPITETMNAPDAAKVKIEIDEAPSQKAPEKNP